MLSDNYSSGDSTSNLVHSEPLSTESLIFKARRGSDPALGELLESFRAHLTLAARQRIDAKLRPKLSESDVVQNSLLIASRDFNEFRGQRPEQLQAWLLKILHGQVIDGLRRYRYSEKRRSDRENCGGETQLRRLADRGDSPSVRVSQREQAAHLLQTILDLPMALRKIVELRYLQGLTIAETADQLQIPTTTCRRRWMEAIERIGQSIEGEC